MYGEDQDRSARIRQIPINVEPRHQSGEQSRNASSRHQQYQTPDNNYDSQNQENLWNYRQTQFDNGQRGSDHRQTSPNTSNVNINYQPHQQERRNCQYQEPRSANTSHISRSSEDRDKSTNNQHQYRAQREEKSPIPRDVSLNSNKKVNSPEPIPLPPPPEQQYQNNKNYNNNTTSPAISPDLNGTSETTTQQTNSSPMSEEDKILSKINAVKTEITNLLEKISQFKEISAKSKDYRYLDEMLTRCVLNLDKIECGNSADMRQQRRAAIKLVDQTTNILQRKLQLNIDIHELSATMSSQ